VTDFGCKSLRIVVDTVQLNLRFLFITTNLDNELRKIFDGVNLVGLGSLLFNVCERGTQLGYFKWGFYFFQ
jgi:hypothetical protein